MDDLLLATKQHQGAVQQNLITIYFNKKAVLSQRRLRDVPYISLP